MKRIGSTTERLKELPYDKRVCRVEFHFPEPAGPPAAVHSPIEQGKSEPGPTVKEWVNLAADMGVEMTVVSGETNRGTPRFNSKMIPPHPHVDNDRLPELLNEAHKKGIIVLSYYSFMYNKPLKKIHPEWLMELIDDGREPIENLGWFCFNSPFRDWLPEYLNEFMENLDLDGFFFDDTNWGSHESRPFYPGCSCTHCEKLFKSETGLKIPRVVDFDSMDFRHFINWRYQKWIDILHHVYRLVIEKNPGVIMDLQYYARPTSMWDDGHPISEVGVNKLGGFYFIETHRTMRESGYTSKICRAMGTPFGIWRNSFQDLAELTGGTAPNPEPYPALLHGLSAIINGGAPYFGRNVAGPLELGKHMMKDVFTQLKKRAPYMDGETVKYVALHCSQQNRDFNPSELPKNTLKTEYMEIGLKEVLGAYEALNRSHLLVDMILDNQLNSDYMKQYPVLFLSDSACLSDRQCEEIRDYVRNGGALIATHQTSILDEFGFARKNFGLADVLGVDYEGPANEKPDSVIYVNQSEDLKKEFGHLVCFVSEESNVVARPDSDVEVLCSRSSLKGVASYTGNPRGRGPLANFDPAIEFDSGSPTVTVNKYGKGQAIYITGDVGNGFVRNAYPPLMRFIAGMVNRIRPPITVQAPQAIEVTAAMTNPKTLMIHILNHPSPMLPLTISDHSDSDKPSGDVATFFALQEIPAIHDIVITFNDYKVKAAHLPLSDLSLPIYRDRVVVPKVEVHEVLLVDLE